MKVIKKEFIGIHPVFSTNVNNTKNYVSEGDIINKNCVVDNGYFGEIHINLINTSNHDIEISEGEKIVQGILLPVGDHQPEEVDDIMKHTENSARGEGGFGSSGNF